MTIEGPGRSLIQCLNTLASITDSHQHSPSTSRHPNRTSPKTLAALEANDKFSEWSTASSGALDIIVPLGDDSSLLFSKLLAKHTTVEMNRNLTVISYVFNPRSPDLNNELVLLSSLCHQLLTLKPWLFKQVEALSKHLPKFDEDILWRVHGLFILFRSLLSSPYVGKTICVLREMDGTKLVERAVANLISVAAQEDSKFKLVIISNAGTTAGIPVIELQQEEFGLEAILDLGLDDVVSNHPALQAIRDALRNGLLAEHKKQPHLFTGFYDVVTSAVRAWLELVVRLAEPVSLSSISRAIDSMPKTMADTYRDILHRLPLQIRQNMRRVLSWLALSQRPLEVPELAAVSALDDSTQTFESIRANASVDLLCGLKTAFGSLIFIDGNRRPLLSTELRAFLLSGHDKDDTSKCDESCVFCLEGELMLARRCLQFLSLYKNCEPGHLIASKDQYPFIGYAIRRWPAHYLSGKNASLHKHEIPGMTPDLTPPDFRKFFEDDNLMKFWATTYDLLRHTGVDGAMPNALTIAAEVGCLDLVAIILPKMDPIRTEDAAVLSQTLIVAISKGDTEMVDLISPKAAPSLTIHAAASSGDPRMSKHLPTSKEDLNSSDTKGYTRLHYACRSGVLGVVKEILDASPDVNVRSRDEEATPLHLACMFGHAPVITYMQELQDLDLNAVDKLGRTPLYYACKSQQPAAVRALFQDAMGRKIDVSLADKDDNHANGDLGMTPLHLAASGGRFDIVRLILEYHCPASVSMDGPTEASLSDTRIRSLVSQTNKFGLTAMHLAARDGRTGVVDQLLKTEAQCDFAASLVPDNDGHLPIHLASKMGHGEVVSLLLESTDLEKQLSGGTYDEDALPIHLAVSHGHVEVVRVLAEHHKRAKLSLDQFYTTRLRTALHFAAMNGQKSILRILVEHGATPDIVDGERATPLLLACYGGHEAVAAVLIERNANINLANDAGVCPLIAAARAGSIGLVQLLLERNATRSVRSKTGKTPLLAAAKFGSAPIMRLLHSTEADWNTKDGKGRSALHLAIKSGDESAVHFVLDSSKLTSDTDAQGQTALHYAFRYNYHSSVVEKILKIDVDLAKVRDEYRQTALHYAVKSESLSAVQTLLDKSAIPLTVDDEGGPLLELATSEAMLQELLKRSSSETSENSKELKRRAIRRSASKGYTATLQHLLKENPEIGDEHDKGETLLHIAARAGEYEIVNHLIKSTKIPPETKDNDGRTALSLAAQEGHVRIVQVLAPQTPTGKEGTDGDGNTPLYHASRTGKLEVVSFLLGEANQGVDPDDLSILNNENKGPLFAAVKGKHTEVVKLLLRQQADPNVVESDYGYTPLHSAVGSRSLEIIDLLLRADGINGNALDTSGRTPMFCAAWDGAEEVVRRLIAAGWVDASPRYSDGWCPIHAAYDNKDILELLVKEANMKVDTADKRGSTALHLAVSYYLESVRFLLEHGANPFQCDNEGITPLHIAARTGSMEALQLMISKASSSEKASLRKLQDATGYTVLLAAVSSGQRSVVDYLLEEKLFDPLVMDNEGQTAIDIAMQANSPTTVAILLESMGSPGFESDTLQQAFIWAVEHNYDGLTKQLCDLLRSREPSELWLEQLIQLVMDTDNATAVKLLRFHSLRPEMATRTDKHNWTINQIVAALEPKSEGGGVDSRQEKPLLPTEWDMDRKAKFFERADSEHDGPVLRMKCLASNYSASAVLANHPIPPAEKFYFEVSVVTDKSTG